MLNAFVLKRVLIISIVFIGIIFINSSCQKYSDNSAADIQELKAAVTALQKRSDSLAAALAVTNNNLGSFAKSVDSIRLQLTNITNHV